jgi:hypothetical protein
VTTASPSATPPPLPPPPGPASGLPTDRATGLERPTIALINASTVLKDADFPAYVAAQQRQIDYDFAPIWGKAAKLVFVPKGGTPPAGAWQCAVLDDADQAGVLGYHDTTSDGHPLGKIFAKTTMSYGGIWTVTASHEILEMLGDPDIVRCVFIQVSDTNGTLYAYENCDAVEADELGYAVDSVTLSDFVTPSWFDPGHYATASGYSFKKRVTSPLTLAPGGYIGYYRVGHGGGWQQKTASTHEASPPLHVAEWHGPPPSPHQLPHPGSRRERRARGRHNWLASTVYAAPSKAAAAAPKP